MNIADQIQDSIACMQKLDTQSIKLTAQMLIDTLSAGNKILVAGNGGSAADASHMAGELVGRFKKERRGYPCIALNTDTSIITAWSNDYCYDTLFSRQVEALGKEGDTFLGISTSGNSENIIKACIEAKKKGMKSILLLGKDGGKLKNFGTSIIVPSDDTPRIQESHILIIHIWCDMIEQAMVNADA